jgi:hypothetical protein
MRNGGESKLPGVMQNGTTFREVSTTIEQMNQSGMNDVCKKKGDSK